MLDTKKIVMLVVSLVVIAVILPTGIGLIGYMGNVIIFTNTTGGPYGNETVYTYLSDVADPTVITLLTVLLPILAVIGIILTFIPGKGEK